MDNKKYFIKDGIVDFSKVTLASNNEKLEKAKKKQAILKELYEGNPAKMPHFTERWGKLIAPEKRRIFGMMYENYFSPIMDRIESHFNKIFDAQGGREVIDFGDNDTLSVLYKEVIQPELFEYGELKEYFKENYIRLLLSQPSSLFLTKYDEDGYVEVELLELEKVKQITTDESGEVDFLAYEEEENSNIWLIITDEFVMKYNNKEKIVLYKYYHGQKKAPLTFVSAKQCGNNPIARKSPLSDSLTDIENYNVFQTFGTYYKSYSAFGTDYVPESLDAKEQNSNTHSFDSNGNPVRAALANQGQNMRLFGQSIEIPYVMFSDETLINNLRGIYFRQDGDTKLLDFQKEDLKSLEEKILADVLGSSYSNMGVGVAKTAAEVWAGMDTQEANLMKVKGQAEAALNAVNSFACVYTELLDSKEYNFPSEYFTNLVENGTYYEKVYPNLSFERYSVNLGNKFFLKGEVQLIEELKVLKEVTSNEFLIREKLEEINNSKTSMPELSNRRFNLVYTLQPYANKSEAWVTQNRVNLPAYSLYVYDNFHSLLSLFEESYGNLDVYAVSKKNSINFVYKKFYEFVKPLYELTKEEVLTEEPQNPETNGRATEENGNSESNGGDETQNNAESNGEETNV